MALSLVEIRTVLSGAKEAAAEADALSASISETGKSTVKANEESSTSASKATKSIAKTSGSLKALGKSMTHYITLPLLAIGAASVDMAAKFDRSVLNLHTQAGIAKKELGGLEDHFKKVARATTFSPTEISEAAYRLAGAGLKGKKLENATTASANLAMVGGADPEDTAKTLAQVWYSGIPGAKEFNHVVAEINATVGAGDLRLSQLVDALGTGVVTSAKQAGLNLHELNGAIAVFGDSTNNVSGWSAQFATALHYFTAPGEKATDAMENLGLKSFTLSDDLAKPNGLIKMLKDLKSHLDALPGGASGHEGKKILGEILPGGRGRVFLTLLNSIDKLEEKNKRITATTKDFGAAIKETEEQPMVKLENAWSNIQTDLVELGQTLIPVVIPALESVASVIQDIAGAFKNLSPEMKKVAGIAITTLAAVGPAMLLGGRLSKAGGGLKSVLSGKGSLGARMAVGTLGVGASQAGGDAVGGDLGNWIKKAGTGASVGYTMAGPLGGLAGGAIGGGIAAYEKLTRVSKSSSHFQLAMARDSKTVAAGMIEQAQAGHRLVGSEGRVKDAHHKVFRTGQQLYTVTRNLRNAYESGHASRKEVLNDELKVTRVLHRHQEAIKKLHSAEKLQGIAQSQYKVIARSTILEERNSINNLGKKKQALDHEYRSLQNNGASLGKLNEVAKKDQTVTGDLDTAHKHMAETLTETTKKVGPGYAKFLENATQKTLDWGSEIKAVIGGIEELGEVAETVGNITGETTPLGNALNGTATGLVPGANRPKKEPGRRSKAASHVKSGPGNGTLIVQAMLPNGKVLAETVKQQEDNHRARGEG